MRLLAVRKALVPSQNPKDAVYATALGALILETYYRCKPVPRE